MPPPLHCWLISMWKMTRPLQALGRRARKKRKKERERAENSADEAEAKAAEEAEEAEEAEAAAEETPHDAKGINKKKKRRRARAENQSKCLNRLLKAPSATTVMRHLTHPDLMMLIGGGSAPSKQTPLRRA